MNEPVLKDVPKQAAPEKFPAAAERLAPQRQEAVGTSSRQKHGSNRWHNLIATNAAVALGSRIQGNRAEIYVNGMCVQLRNDLVSYPSVVIVTGEPAFTDANADVLRNPTIVFEVFSTGIDTTEKARKLEAYLALESIKECLQIKADEMRVEHFAKQNAKQWIYKIYNERDDVISLDSIGIKISLAELYAQVNLRQAEFSSKAVN
ncbi:MAG: Uma2 family endonuclease [Pyrinomonadaceae bacterium]